MSAMTMLVGVDGSDASHRAIEWCAEYARRLDANVVVVHAVEQPVVVAPVTTGFVLPEFTPADREEISRIVTDDWCAPLTAASVPFRVVLKDGALADARRCARAARGTSPVHVHTTAPVRHRDRRARWCGGSRHRRGPKALSAAGRRIRTWQ
jgi:nucleotide-binding universal stress UspA family protein